MSGANPNNPNHKEAAPWLAIIVVAAIVLFWYIAHKQIAFAVMWVRWAEAHLMFLDPEGKAALIRWLSSTTAAEASLAGLIQSGAVAGYTLRWFSLAFLLLWFGWLIKKSPGRTGRYSSRYTMQSLARQEAAQWPVLTPVLGLDLQDVPLDDPINGMRRDGRAYSRQHRLVHPRWTDPNTLKCPDGSPADLEALGDGRWFDMSRARTLFASQLGRPWQGVEELRPYERGLYAAFAAQVGHDRDMALAILNELAIAARSAFDKRDPWLLESATAVKALAKYGDTPAVQKLVRGHHYCCTVLIAVLEAARENGVLAAAWFRWLKMADRRMWYALNDLGLDVASVEAAGIRAHYQAESIAKTAIAEPLIEPAIKGLVEYLNTYLDDETEE